MPSEMSARRADYLAWTSAQHVRKPLPDDLAIDPCRSLESLAEVRGALKKLKHDSHFMAKIFEHRCKQLYPRDLLVATVQTRKGGRLAPRDPQTPYPQFFPILGIPMGF